MNGGPTESNSARLRQYRYRRAWLTSLAAALALVSTLPVAPTARADAPSSRATATASTQPLTRVFLPTGERLALRWSSGRPTVIGEAGDPELAITTSGNDVYAIPREALPFVGSTLDRSLFDVTRLAMQEGSSAQGAVAVRMRFEAGPVEVPGVVAARPAAAAGSGKVTRTSAELFGAALRSAGRAALRVGGVSRHGAVSAREAQSPIPGLVEVALAGPAPATLRPDFVQVTLTVNVVLPTDRDVLGTDVYAVNTDDTRKYAATSSIGAGYDSTKISVPKGHYDLVAAAYTANVDGSEGPTLVATAVDYSVSGSDQTVTLDTGKATAALGYEVPRPTVLQAGFVDFSVSAGGRSAAPYTVYLDAGSQVLVQPTPKSTVGVLSLNAYESRLATEPSAPGGGGVSYSLASEWPDGIPSHLTTTINAAGLATVSDTFAPDGATGDVDFLRGVEFTDDTGAAIDVPEPSGHDIEYLYSKPDLRWFAYATLSLDPEYSAFDSEASTFVRYAPGRAYTVDWFRGLLRAGFADELNPYNPPVANACRRSGSLSLQPSALLDSDRHHFGLETGSSPGYEQTEVSADGTVLVDQTDLDGRSIDVPVPAAARTYRIVESVDRAKLGFTTATKLHTVLTVRSSSTSGPAVPTSWSCGAAGASRDTIVPLLADDLPVLTSPTGTLSIGATTFVARVDHVPGGGNSPITGFALATSSDGTTFTPAKIRSLGSGRYRVTLTNPPVTAGQAISIRLHAVDAAGSTLPQTITDAYRVAAS